MADQRRIMQKLAVGKDFTNDTAGIIYTIMPPYDLADDDGSTSDHQMLPRRPDPVIERNRRSRKRSKSPSPAERPPTPETAITINPSISTRVDLSKPACMRDDLRLVGDALVKYVPPKMKGSRKAAKQRRKHETDNRLVCEYTVVRMPSPLTAVDVNDFVMISPDVSKAKVMPMKPSATSADVHPEPPTKDQLALHKPKSGVIINPKDDVYECSSSDEETEIKDKEAGFKKEDDRLSTIEDVSETDEDWENGDYFEDYEGREPLFYTKATAVDNDQPLRMIRKKVSQMSAATSLNEKDLMFEDLNWDKIPAISKLVQTFRSEQEDQEVKTKKKKTKKGTLESHSFTKIKQKTEDKFCFKFLAGTIHQGDDNFLTVSRNKQGICMPIAAFCYSKLKMPEVWNEKTVDDVIEIGDKLFLDSIGSLHMHKNRKELNVKEVQKFCVINTKKVKFDIEEPFIHGQMRSLDKRIYNVTKGLKIFFDKYKSGLFQTSRLNVAIWKHKKYYYIFDSNPRNKDIFEDLNGKAALICVQNLKAVISILLDRSVLGNSPFLLSKIKVVKVMGVEDPDHDDVEDTFSIYNILNDKKAVVQGTFDLGDKCFMFTRNKQALAMATVALVYSRITSPSTWKRKTLDKIMIIGNQLYVEIVKYENVIEIGLENLPAVFTIGPYIVEIFIYANCHADTMFKKGQCAFHEILNVFFEKNNNAIVQIGKHTLGIWHQRNMYYCFDPYSRNNEGLRCRNGSACVTMNSDLQTLVDTIIANFEEPEVIFYVHALKVIRIHRDPAASRLFPRSMTLNEVSIENFKKMQMRKSKKKAVEKAIKTDFTEYAMKKLLAGGDSPGPSLIDIDSNIGSLNQAYLPPFMQKLPPKELIKIKLNEMSDVCDLDSPTLSETQISPVRPTPLKNEDEITLMDLDSFDLTQEELELQDDMEGEDDIYEVESEIIMAGEDYEDQEGEEDYYLGRSVYSQVNSSSLESTHRRKSEEINTDITYCYKILPTLEHPLKSKRYPDKGFDIVDDLQAIELRRETAFERIDDVVDMIQGGQNIANFGENVDEMACYACIFATGYSFEESLYKWYRKTVDFLLKSGFELYMTFQEPYYKIKDFHLEFQKTRMTIDLEILLDTYVEEKLFQSENGPEQLATLLENYVFSHSKQGYFFTSVYSCVIILKHNLLYLFEPYGSNKSGKIENSENKGLSSIMRFKDLTSLSQRILQNWQARLPEDKDGFCREFTRVTLIEPVISSLSPGGRHIFKPGTPDDEADEPVITQSQELNKPHNFVNLPDATQLVRGTAEIKDYGELFEVMAPYACIMAAAVSAKYSVATWSTEVINYILECGVELFKKSKIRFEEVAKLEIPKVSLGKTDFSLVVNYHFDAPVKEHIIRTTLKKVLKQHGDWAIIVTQEFACATYLKNYLYYLFDCYATNEVGLSEGSESPGYASLSRFRDLDSLATRIVFNKKKREEKETLEYTRFVLCTVSVKKVRKDQGVKKRRGEKDAKSEDEEEDEDEWMEQEGADEEPSKKEEKGAKEKEQPEPPKNKVGFQYKDGFYVIEGSNSLEGGTTASELLKEDHFVCLCACLMVINCPVMIWDTKKVDRVIDLGKHIYSHATNLEVSEKRTIKNILMFKYFFDIIVKPIKINNWKKNRNIDVGLKTILSKRKYCLVQFPNCCLVIYKFYTTFYLFSPYSWTYKNSDNQETSVQAGWVVFTNEKRLKNKVKSFMAKDGEGLYSFYSFEVISLRKAPKKVQMAQRLQKYEVDKPEKSESIGKPFHEHKSWLDIHQFPWSRMKDETAGGKQRGKRDGRWHNWDTEYSNDLYSLVGTLHQTSRKFSSANRGKQTLANLVVAIAMTNIYELSEWNAAILNSVLANGDHYFTQCIKDIKDDNYEMAMEDLIEDCTIFPYTFKISYTPAIEGTMFLDNVKKFNLYKALRYFFENYESRCGVIVASKGENKRLAAFGKVQENEYFMYDCQSIGPPMFFEREGASYILRCITLARLLHVLILTLKGGDFYIYDVETYNFEPMN